jgi:ABC-type dipeptide/oligopeptide/nickel transport system permease subunit
MSWKGSLSGIIARPLARFMGAQGMVKAGIAITFFFFGLGIVAAFYTPYQPLKSVGPPLEPPSLKYLFGTTSIGQDVFSQWMYAAIPTLEVGLVASVLTTVIGVVVGITAGFTRYADEPLMRLSDVVLSLPTLPLLIVVAAFVKPSLVTVAVLIALLEWASLARVVRSSVLTLKHSPYVEVALLSRVPRYKIMMVDMIRHTFPLIVAYALFAVGDAILSEAALDFIGVGPISSSSWGAMIAISQNSNALLNGAWWWSAVPGLSIATVIFGFALVAYGLETMYKVA